MNPQDHTSTTKPSSQPEGPSWQFYFVMIVIAIGVLGIIVKALGLF